MQIPLVTIPGTNLRVSRFIFGTDRLFNVGSARKRAALLNAAIDAGFTHFDTAPLYGFGMAERDLAPVLARHPYATISTKIGLYAPGGEDQGAASIFLRKAIGKIMPAMSAAVARWHVEKASETLAGSMRRLGRNRIDAYFLHEPISSVIDTEEWQRWMEDRVCTGDIGVYGVAANSKLIGDLVLKSPSLVGVVQTTDSIDRMEADILTENGRDLQITYGYVSSAKARMPDMSVDGVLRAALRRNRTGAIIVRTNKIERLPQYPAFFH
jgi:D-threo-aldose 1-dehydrogenase